MASQHPPHPAQTQAAHTPTRVNNDIVRNIEAEAKQRYEKHTLSAFVAADEPQPTAIASRARDHTNSSAQPRYKHARRTKETAEHTSSMAEQLDVVKDSAIHTNKVHISLNIGFSSQGECTGGRMGASLCILLYPCLKTPQ